MYIYIYIHVYIFGLTFTHKCTHRSSSSWAQPTHCWGRCVPNKYVISPYMNKSCHTYEWGIVTLAHLYISYVMYIKERFLSHMRDLHFTYEWVMSHIRMICVNICMNRFSHVCASHVTHTNESMSHKLWAEAIWREPYRIHPTYLFEIPMALSTNSGSFPSNSSRIAYMHEPCLTYRGSNSKERKKRKNKWVETAWARLRISVHNLFISCAIRMGCTMCKNDSFNTYEKDQRLRLLVMDEWYLTMNEGSTWILPSSVSFTHNKVWLIHS